MIKQPDHSKPRDAWSDPRTTPAADGLREGPVETTETQKRTSLTRVESRRRMIKGKRIGWEGTVSDYCTEVGLTEVSHGSMVRNYLKALVESGEAVNLTPKKQKNIYYKILRRKRAASSRSVPPRALLEPAAPTQERMLELLVSYAYAVQSLSLSIVAVQYAIADELVVPQVVWRDKGWRTAFSFALVVLRERGVVQYNGTTISVSPALFADVDQWPEGGPSSYTAAVLAWRNRRRQWEKILQRSGPTLLALSTDGGS